MKTQGESIDKEDKIVRVDMEGLPEDMTEQTNLKDAAGLTNPVPYMSILQLTDVAVEGKKTFKGKAGMVLGVADNEQSLEFIEGGGGGGGGCNLDPITLVYSEYLSVNVGRNLNYVLTLTGDCFLNLTNVIPGCVYQFIIKQDGVGGHTLYLGGTTYRIPGFTQNKAPNSVSKLIIDNIDSKMFVTMNLYTPVTVQAITITWRNYDNTLLDTDYITTGVTPVYTGPTPIRTGFTFMEWNPTPAPVTTDTTYTAVFGAGITWKNYDDTVLSTDVVAIGDTPVYSGPTPVKPSTGQYSYTFDGWLPAVDVATGNQVYTAQYIQTTNTYTVTWQDFDGTTLETDTGVAYGTTPTYDGATPTRTGYIFTGWSPTIVPVETNAVYTAQYMAIGIYWNPTDGLISLSSDGTNWITIQDKNLGATVAYNDGDTLSQSNCGNYYQWGNNYGFPYTGTINTSTSQVNVSSYGPGNYYNSDVFINPTSRDEWGQPQSYTYDLWGGVTDTDVARQGPCDTGYKVPNVTEFTNLINVVSSLGISDHINTCLKIPAAGYRYPTPYQQGSNTYVATAIVSTGTYPSKVSYYNGSTIYTGFQTFGYSVRGFKNTPVIPGGNWELVWGTGMYTDSQFQTNLRNNTMSANDILTELNNNAKAYYNSLGISFIISDGDGLMPTSYFYQYNTGTYTWTYTTAN